MRIYQSSRFKAKDFFFSFLQVVWSSESEFNEFEPRLKSAKNRFQSRAGLNLETLSTILSGNNHIEPRL